MTSNKQFCLFCMGVILGPSHYDKIFEMQLWMRINGSKEKDVMADNKTAL